MIQNVRTREEIETELQRLLTHGARGPNAAWQVVHRIFDEVRAYGAEEQRRKDGEGQEPVAWQYEVEGLGGWISREVGYGPNVWRRWASHVKPDMSQSSYRNLSPLYDRPTNVAALEARIADLEKGIARIEKQANEYPGDDAGALGWISSECAALTREGTPS